MDSFLTASTRFAPSPSGFLHFGHANGAQFYARHAERIGGQFLLRIEDIDPTRSKPEYEQAIYEDLRWLGLTWPEPVVRQSDRFSLYGSFLHTLEEGGLTYPCFCTRKEIRAEVANAPRAPHGPDGALYPGTCKNLDPMIARDRIAAGQVHAIRLHMNKAAHMTGPLTFTDLDRGEILVRPNSCGDVVLARKDVPTSYHLSVTVDDALQHISCVTRGEDLLHATHIHRVLQTLLGFPTPVYRHHRLLMDPQGRRYAKRDKAITLRTLRAAGLTPADVIERIGL
ncbi:MAG: tRNA glutamyl-Q(34) synthetase GluQRS [Alphaproteobacteria bacterium]|nr:tRNA glutamyl-Q(34) synthetase GluQRS [Alphaproteobacteria bacterium]